MSVPRVECAQKCNSVIFKLFVHLQGSKRGLSATIMEKGTQYMKIWDMLKWCRWTLQATLKRRWKYLQIHTSNNFRKLGASDRSEA